MALSLSLSGFPMMSSRFKHCWIQSKKQKGVNLGDTVKAFHMSVWNQQVRIQPVLSVLVATLTGFAVTVFGHSIIVEVWKWRTRSPSSSNQRQGPDRLTENADQFQTDPHHHASGMGDVEAIHGG